MNITGLTPAAQLSRPDGSYIAYHRTRGKRADLPGVVFIHGLRSDMDGEKATRLHEFCAERGQSFVRFDCRGHGQSSSKFEETTLSDWASDAKLVIEQLTQGPQIVVGSSMGGWLMLLSALALPNRVTGLVGIAAAPDFTRSLQKSLSKEEAEALTRDGLIRRPSEYAPEPYVFTKALLDDGNKNVVLEKPIAFHGRTRLLHGMLDDAVPWELSLEIAEKIESEDVKVILIKDGDHRLSRESDIRQMHQAIIELSDPNHKC